MKKLFLFLAMFIASFTATYAEGNNTDECDFAKIVEAYDLKIDINNLARFLHLRNWQAVSIESVHDVFTEQLKNAAYFEADRRKKYVNTLIKYDLRNVKAVLTEEQYKKYLTVFNATMINRGIEW